MSRCVAAGAGAAFILAVVAANWLTESYGFVPVWFGLETTAGTYAAGAAFLLRDLVQEIGGRSAVVVAILVGSALTFIISPSLAVASAVAFLVAEFADMAVYTPLRLRGWVRAVLASNVVGAVVDTYVFLWLADFPVTMDAVSGQLVGKLLWATLVPVLFVVGARALLRQSVRT